MKTGYKTTEFWLTLAVVVVGTLTASGVFGDDDGAVVIQAIGILITALAPSVYTISRGIAKSS